MAIAGLHNASALDSSFLRESQSLTSRRWLNNQERRRSNSENTSEDANEAENETGTWSHGRNSSSSDQSIDFGENERDRVRQIFQEWMNSGVRGRGGSNVPDMNNCSRAQWLGENERGRVRIIREWVHMTSQERGEQAAEVGGEIEQVRDGLIVNHCEIGSPRPIRKLCGRQALLDLLVRAEMERQRELRGLLERRPVSDFPHRNRIQSLLRGRFLRNERLTRDERPTSMAANELGLLRQRHTVSDLREGFLSRLDNCVRSPANSIQSDSSSDKDMNSPRNEQIQINNSQGGRELSDPTDEEIDTSEFTDDLQVSIGEHLSRQQSTAQLEERQEQVLENNERVQQFALNFESFENRIVMGEEQETSRHDESEERGHHPEALELIRENIREEGDAHGSPNRTDNFEVNSVENISWHESVVGSEETGWQVLDNVEVSEWRNSIGEDVNENSHGVSASEWYQTSENEEEEHIHLQEQDEVWHENDIHEDTGNWLEGPSVGDASPVERVTSFYLPDNDNEQSTEIRELLSRRSVSSLLQSGFRESLNQLIQSYVERQGHASGDWEEDETLSSHVLMEQDLEQQSSDQDDGHSYAVERTPLIIPSASVTTSQPLWDPELHDSNWPRHNLHQPLGIEWEIINDLRIDLARLQQRMNSMQRMLEACMDMQLELQRAVHQEVSAALNRSAVQTVSEEGRNCVIMDGSKWDHVRKGICCICSDSNIDSLLYRCGHMCTCSKCADKLVQASGKCPMCHAPVVEVIRAYSIQ